MKNNTKLIMETWRRFLKEDILDDEPPEGYYDDDYNPDGFDPDAVSLDNPIDGEPPFDHAEPPEEDDMMADDDYDEIPYTQEDAMMSPEQRQKAFEERYDDELEYSPEDPEL